MKRLWIHALPGLVVLSGCATVDLSEAFLTPEVVRGLDLGEASDSRAVADASPSATEALFPDLRSVVLGPTSGAMLRDAPPPVLPEFVREDDAVQKITVALDQALNRRNESRLELSASDIRGLVQCASRSLSAQPASTRQDRGFVRRVRTYLFAYYTSDKGYVRRDGTVLKATKVGRAVTNEQIVPVVSIFVDAVLDEVLKVRLDSDVKRPYPVLKSVDGQSYAVKERPTVSRYQAEKLNESIDMNMVPAGDSGVTEDEFKGIRFVSGQAAENSEMLSGMAVRALGDIELSFVVGAHFSFGDNDTLARVVDTVVKSTVRGSVEAAATVATWHRGGAARLDSNPAIPRSFEVLDLDP